MARRPLRKASPKRAKGPWIPAYNRDLQLIADVAAGQGMLSKYLGISTERDARIADEQAAAMLQRLTQQQVVLTGALSMAHHDYFPAGTTLMEKIGEVLTSDVQALIDMQLDALVEKLN